MGAVVGTVIRSFIVGSIIKILEEMKMKYNGFF